MWRKSKKIKSKETRIWEPNRTMVPSEQRRVLCPQSQGPSSHTAWDCQSQPQAGSPVGAVGNSDPLSEPQAASCLRTGRFCRTAVILKVQSCLNTENVGPRVNGLINWKPFTEKYLLSSPPGICRGISNAAFGSYAGTNPQFCSPGLQVREALHVLSGNFFKSKINK